jgi:hypothetical protein
MGEEQAPPKTTMIDFSSGVFIVDGKPMTLEDLLAGGFAPLCCHPGTDDGPKLVEVHEGGIAPGVGPEIRVRDV